jgi:hypothetical protein
MAFFRIPVLFYFMMYCEYLEVGKYNNKVLYSIRVSILKYWGRIIDSIEKARKWRVNVELNNPNKSIGKATQPQYSILNLS